MIYPGSSHSYITTRVVEICAFKKVKYIKSWLVQLATGTKRKVSEVVEKCPLVMNGLITCVDLNVLPLGSYDVLIGMDWLEAHQVKLDYYNKTFECMDEEGNPVVVKGILKVISVRQVSVMQLKKFYIGKVSSCTQLIFWNQQEMKLLGWRTIRCYRNSRCVS